MKWGDWIRPDDAAFIVILLNGGGRGAAHPDAIAAHDGKTLLTFVIEDRRIHALAVFGSKEKHLADLDALCERQSPVSPGRQVAGLRVPKICELVDRKVAIPVGVQIMGIGLIRADHHIAHSLDAMIRQNPYLL